MPERRNSDHEIANNRVLNSIEELRVCCNELLDMVIKSHERSHGVEVILALILSRIMANGPATVIAVDCASLLEEIRETGLDPSSAKFPDPRLLDDVIGILTNKTRQPWRPYVIAGGRTDPQIEV